jgi:hypothetical protein
MMLRKRLNALKREQFPWMLEVSKCAAQEAIINLGVSFSNFFRDCKKPKAQRRFHYPKPCANSLSKCPAIAPPKIHPTSPAARWAYA